MKLAAKAESQDVPADTVDTIAADILETQCEFHVIYPTLFTSLRLNYDKRSALIHDFGEGNFKAIEEYTGGYALLGLQDRLGVDACASTVRKASERLKQLKQRRAEAGRRAAIRVPEAVRARAQQIVDKSKKKVCYLLLVHAWTHVLHIALTESCALFTPNTGA